MRFKKLLNHKLRYLPFLALCAGYIVALSITIFTDRTPYQMTGKNFTQKAILHTSKGEIVLAFDERSPKAVYNFIRLAKSGFYTNTKFHRSVPKLLLQGGDPLTKDLSKKAEWGHGGPGYVFHDEFHKDDKMNRGVVAMANNGPNTNGSQFFIVTAPSVPIFVGRNTIFAKVIDGMQIVDMINTVPISVTEIPLEDIVIYSITIVSP